MPVEPSVPESDNLIKATIGLNDEIVIDSTETGLTAVLKKERWGGAAQLCAVPGAIPGMPSEKVKLAEREEREIGRRC